MYAHSELSMSIFFIHVFEGIISQFKRSKNRCVVFILVFAETVQPELSGGFQNGIYRLCVFNAWNFYPWKCRLACEVWAFLTTFSFHTALQRERRASCGTVVHLRARVYKAGLCRLEQMFVELRPAGLHQDVRWEIWEKGDYRPEEKIYWVR